MKSLRKRVELLRRRVRDMRRLIVTPRNAADPVAAGDGAMFTPEAAFHAVLAAAQLAELEPVALGFQLRSEKDGEDGFRALEELDQGILALALNALTAQAFSSRLTNGSGEDLFDDLVSWREWSAVHGYLQDHLPQSNSLKSFFLDWAARCESMLNTLSPDDQAATRTALRQYLANQWLYPWATTTDGQGLDAIYGWLFDIAGVPKGDSTVFSSDPVRRALGGAQSDSQLEELLASVLEAIERAVAEYGLDSLEDILADGGVPLPRLPPDVGVIPGDRAGPCPRVLVGFATTKSPKSRFGAVSVMRKLRDALIACCDGSAANRTEIAIFVGPIDQIDRVIEESAGDLEGHLRKGVLKAFIPVGVLRGRTNILAWR